MKTQPLGSTDLNVSPICCGAAPFGVFENKPELERFYDAFRAAGGNFFDTAHCYGFWMESGQGAHERSLAKIVRSRGDQDRVIIATKGGHPSVPPQYLRPDAYLSPEVLSGDITDSLQRLQRETIDLYFLHRDDLRLSVGEIMDTLQVERVKGRLRHFGASNWTSARIAEANAYAKGHGYPGFVANEVLYNLGKPNLFQFEKMWALDETDHQWHTRSQIPVLAYTPNASGYFATGGKAGAEVWDNPTDRARLQRVEQLAMELKVTPNQIVLAYLMNQPFPVIPITGTTKLEHLSDSIKAASLRLTPEQVKWLEA